LKQDIESGNKVIMLTARSDFNDRDVFLDTFRQYGIDMDRVHVYRAGNLVTRAATEEKKKIILKHLLGKHAYEKVIMYDDSVPNLNAFLSLKQDFPYTEFYAWHVDPAGRADEYHRTGLDEGLRDTLAGLALGAGVALGGGAEAKTEKIVVSPGQTVYSIARAFDTTPETIQRANRLDRKMTIRPGQTLVIPQPGVKSVTRPAATPAAKPAAQAKPAVKQYQTAQLKTLTGTAAEAIAKRLALQQGLKGVELAAFLAQIKHESWDFKRMHEVGDKRYFQRMYDKKYKPGKAKGLGNTEFGDGVRYRGRGYMQLTGRDNYRRVGRQLGVDLERNPELAARPDIAAQIALMYWKQRVRPNVRDWSNVAQVTRPINSRLSHLEDRKRDFAAYVDFYKLADQI
jgi:predicted chitinase